MFWMGEWLHNGENRKIIYQSTIVFCTLMQICLWGKILKLCTHTHTQSEREKERGGTSTHLHHNPHSRWLCTHHGEQSPWHIPLRPDPHREMKSDNNGLLDVFQIPDRLRAFHKEKGDNSYFTCWWHTLVSGTGGFSPFDTNKGRVQIFQSSYYNITPNHSMCGDTNRVNTYLKMVD